MTALGILSGILILGLIMLIHELGHFLAGRFFRFKIDQFSIFMGPVLFERERKGIRYNIKMLPFGASVSFTGMDSELEGQGKASDFDPEDPDLFDNKPKWQRALVIAMGPVLNFLTALIVFILLFSFRGVVVPDVGRVDPGTLLASTAIEPGDTITSLNGMRISTTLDLTMAEMSRKDEEPWEISYRAQDGTRHQLSLAPQKAPARPMLGITYSEMEDGRYIIQSAPAGQGEAGLLPDDQILAIEGIPFGNTEEITALIGASEGKPLSCQLIRQGQELTLEVTPTMLEVDLPLGLVLTLSKKPVDILSQGLIYPYSVFRSTIRGFGMLFAGQIGVRDSLAGPIGIVSLATDTVTQSKSLGDSLANLATLLGLLSVAIGFTNLLPIPPLDGNHLLLLGVEAIRGKPLSPRFKSVTATVGLIIFMILGFMIIGLDLARLFGW